MLKNILVSGSVAFDVIFSVPHDFRQAIPLEDGEIRTFNASYTASRKNEYEGGTAGNIAFWLGMEGVSSTVFSAWGRDFAQKGYRHKLERLGVKLIGKEGDHTAHAYIISDPLHQQLTIWQPNDYEEIDQLDLMGYIDPSEYGLAIFAAGSPTSISSQLLAFRRFNREAIVIFDPGQVTHCFRQEEFAECVAASDVIIGNNIEYRHFQEFGLAPKILQIETLGRDGAVVRQNGEIQLRVPAVRVDDVINTTGAGDAFRAGFIAELAAGGSIEKAVERGVVFGAKCVKVASGQYSLPDDELQD